MRRLVPARWRLLAIPAALLAVLLASCGQQASFSVQLGSSGDSVLRGDHVTVPVTVSNASGTVTLSVSGAPSGVTASLADGSLSGGATSTTLDVQVSAAASDGSATLTVNAVQGSDASSATFALTVASLSVHGTVVDPLENGVSGATVAIQGSTATTDANGSFTVGGVAVPYDLIVEQTLGASGAAHVFEGLTSATPEVNTYASIVPYASPPMSATISGNLSAAVSTGYDAVVCAQSSATVMMGCDTVSVGGTAYSIAASWVAGASVPVTLHAIEVAADSDGFATGYGRYGTASGSVSDGGTPTIDVSWGSTPTSSNVVGTVNVPAGFFLSDVKGAADLSASTALPLFAAYGTSSSPVAASFTTAVPQIAGSGSTVTVRAITTAGAATIAWQQGVTGGSVTFDLATPPTQTAPADGATGVGAGSTMSVSSASGAVTFVISSPSQVIVVTTIDSSISLPDLSSVGMSWGSTTSYDWQAVVTPTATTPEAAALGWYRDYILTYTAVGYGGRRTNVTNGSILGTLPRSFTTP